MSEMSAHVPKPLLYLPAGTLLDHQLASLARLPISRTFVVIHHRAEEVDQALQGYEGVTVVPQRPPLTLLGALASAEGYVTEPFIVLHGDNYFSHGLDYLLSEAQTADCTFLVDPQTEQINRAHRLASTGCYVLTPEAMPVVKRLQDGDKLSDLTGALLRTAATVREVSLRGWRVNVNYLRDLLQASRLILEEWSGSLHPPGAAEGYNRAEGCLKAHIPLWVSTESEVVDSRLGPYVVVGPHACVRNCTLREVIVFPGSEIVDQKLEGGVVLPAETGFVLLTPQDQVHGNQKSYGEEEPA